MVSWHPSVYLTQRTSKAAKNILASPHLILSISFIFMGRLGPLTLAYFLASPKSKRLRYPETKLTIG